MLVVGIGLWTIYGVMRAARSIWLGNGITMVLAASILSVKLLRAANFSGGLNANPALIAGKQIAAPAVTTIRRTARWVGDGFGTARSRVCSTFSIQPSGPYISCLVANKMKPLLFDCPTLTF
jgi:hypothetical protein